MYNEKKVKIKEEQDRQLKHMEDQMLANKNKKVVQRYNSMSNPDLVKGNHNFGDFSLRVDERLYKQNKLIELKKEAMRQERFEEEKAQLKNPQINQKSEKILSGKEEFKLKVEDRLIGIGKMWKDKKDLQIKAYIHQVES